MTSSFPPALLLVAAGFAMACVTPVSLGVEDAGVDALGADSGGPKRDSGPKDAGVADASQCASGALGNAGGACNTDDSFFVSASAACSGSSGFLSQFKPDEHCGAGSSSSATYACCAAAPSGTSSGGFGNANGVCDPDSTMFLTAEEGCTSQKEEIVAFVPNESCGQGMSSSATYSCAP